MKGLIMNHVFSSIPKIDIPRSKFRRPHNLKTTIGTDYLYPIYVGEALPASTIKLRHHIFGRLTTPVVPIMDNLYLDTFYFAVPIRLIDDNWEKFMGARPFGDTTTVYTVPTLQTDNDTPADTILPQSLSDYLGIPPGIDLLEFCSYWHRAYNLIWNEWFRDENLCQPVPVGGKHYDGTFSAEEISDYVLLKRGKRHDYATSCLPWPQKGDPVTLSLGSVAPVRGNGNALIFNDGSRDLVFGHGNVTAGATSVASNLYGWDRNTIPSAGSYTPVAVSSSAETGAKAVGLSTSVTDQGLVADLSVANPITINQLREAFALQALLEVDARGGTRYIEILRAHFSVVSPDARMQRPEYLGGTSEPLIVSTVPQTSSTDATSPQGNLAAFVTARNEAGFTKSFTEHCVILGLANVRADLSYQQGLPRMFSRKTRYDFYWPELANLGEQAVLNKEIYAQGRGIRDVSGNIIDDLPFGYQERWAEYRYSPSMITGLFRSQVSGSLDVWHLAQYFTSLPKLNAEFISESVPIARSLAVQNEPPLILDAFFEEEATLPMPLYSVPGLRRM